LPLTTSPSLQRIHPATGTSITMAFLVHIALSDFI